MNRGFVSGRNRRGAIVGLARALAILVLGLAALGVPVRAAQSEAVGVWDTVGVRKPSVLLDGTAYKMWYEGIDTDDNIRVGLATSVNGRSWKKFAANPIFDGTPGAWDGDGEHAPFVIKDGSTYKMWYEGSNGSVRQLGYATSSDGITWTKYAGNPVLTAGPEAYDSQVAGHGSLLYDNGVYKLWYHAIGDQGIIIAYATSPDGITWTKAGPVLLPNAGGWDSNALWGPSVLKIDTTYYMWYSAAGNQYPVSIGLATSTNGTTWTRVGAVPVVMDPGGTDQIGDPHVLYSGGLFRMWHGDFSDGAIYYEQSTDGITWTTPALALGSSGHLDTSFSGDGKLSTTFAAGQPAWARSVVTQSNGKITVAGDSTAPSATNSNIYVARYTQAGALDTTFKSTGKLVINLGANEQARALLVLPTTGKLVLAGQKCPVGWIPCDAVVIRLNANGSMDTTFNGTGRRIDDVGGGDNGSLAAAVYPGGKIVAAGYMLKASGDADFAVIRYTAAGGLDTTFSGDGKQTISFGAGRQDVARAIAVQTDGKILVAGKTCDAANANCNFALARLNANGALDLTFNKTGKQITNLGGSDFASAIAIQQNGKIVLAGGRDWGGTSYFALARYNTNGTLDTTFAGTGKTVTDFSGDANPDYITAMHLQSNGMIVACGDVYAGSTSNFALARYTTTGVLDTSFSTDGKAVVDFGQDDHCLALAREPDQTYVVAGYSDTGTLKKWVVGRVLP